MSDTLTTASGLRFTVENLTAITGELGEFVHWDAFTALIIEDTICFIDMADAFDAMSDRTWLEISKALNDAAWRKFQSDRKHDAYVRELWRNR